MKTLIATLLATGLCSGASALTVSPCDWVASAQALVEPWEEYSRTYSNGKTRIALLDTVEPAAGAFHILVLSPPYNELGDRQCRVISVSEGQGFMGIDFGALSARYDPSIGLMFRVPVQFYDEATGFGRPARLDFTLNQATGHIGLSMMGGE